MNCSCGKKLKVFRDVYQTPYTEGCKCGKAWIKEASGWIEKHVWQKMNKGKPFPRLYRREDEA